jgi:ankyrin repeat protein
VNAKDSYGDMPLHLAVQKGNLNIVRALIKAGADVNAEDHYENTPLHHARSEWKLDIVKELITNKADVNAKCYDGGKPLHGRYYLDVSTLPIY